MHFSPCRHPVQPALFVEETIFHCMGLASLSKIKCRKICWLISGCLIWFHWWTSLFLCNIMQFLIIIAMKYSLRSKSIIPLEVLLFFRIVLANLGFFLVHMKSRIALSRSIKIVLKFLWGLHWIYRLPLVRWPFSLY